MKTRDIKLNIEKEHAGPNVVAGIHLGFCVFTLMQENEKNYSHDRFFLCWS
jgi:hypothetical protein